MSRTESVDTAPFSSGLVGPIGLAWGSSPLLLPTYNFNFDVSSSELGYQPEGMNPITWLSPASFTFTTAMQLLSAFATNSILFLRSSVNAFGVDPCGARAVGPTLMVSIAWRFRVSITVTVFSFPFDTYKRPSEPSSMSFGLWPVG